MTVYTLAPYASSLTILVLAVIILALTYGLSLVVTFYLDKKKLRLYKSLTTFCGLTDLAYLYHNATLNMTRSEDLLEAHKEHKILRLGPSRLSFSTPGAIKDIYGTSTPCIKGDQYTTAGGVPHLLTVVDKPAHSMKRKRLSAAFSTQHMLDWEFKVADKITKLIKQLDKFAARSHTTAANTDQKESPKTLDFRYWSNLFTMDAIADIALSHQCNFLESGNDAITTESSNGKHGTANMLASLQAVNRAIGPIVWDSTMYPVLKMLTKLVPSYNRQWKLTEKYSDIVRHLVSVRLARAKDDEELDDLFACLLHNSKGEPLNLNRSEIEAETGHLLDAGSDTTSIALSHIIYFLARNPDALVKLRSELKTTVKDANKLPTYAEVRSVPYLRACLDESMRLRPPLSAGMQRLTPSEGTTIDGTWIAGNVNVSIPAFVVQRNPEVFPDPAAFKPERWLGEEGKNLQRYTLTFSAGARVCIGKNISYIEQSMLVAAMVLRYDFNLPSPHWKMAREEFFNLWPQDLPLSLYHRQDTNISSEPSI